MIYLAINMSTLVHILSIPVISIPKNETHSFISNVNLFDFNPSEPHYIYKPNIWMYMAVFWAKFLTYK